MAAQKFSIILPVKNGGLLVKECVQSILSQTLQDFNLLILDNKSNDGTSEWLATLKDNRIKIFPSSESLSIEDNWKRIIDIPKSEFATLIGHDDILMPNFLHTINELIQTYPDASLYRTNFIFIDSYGNEIRNCLATPELMDAGKFINKSLQRAIDINGTGFVFRSSKYDLVQGIPNYPKLLFADYALWFSLVNNGSIATAKITAFKYRIHQNTSQTASPTIYINALRDFVSFLKELKTNQSLAKGIKKHAPEFIAYYCKSICHKLLRFKAEERNRTTVYQIVSEFEKECRDISENPAYSIKKLKGIKSALLIDSNAISRLLFRMLRKLYPPK